MRAFASFGDTRLPERFWSKVQPCPMSGCWIWVGTIQSQGYGQTSFNDVKAYAHRASYERLIAPIPTGLDLDHLCRVRSCCNPLHLEPVTRRENLLRGETLTAAMAQKTHCPNGHELSGSNLYPKDKFRRCRTCVQAGNRRAHAKRAAARKAA